MSKKVTWRSLAIPLAAVVLVVWVAAVGGSSASAGSPEYVWVLTRTLVNPEDEPPPDGSKVVTRPGHLDWEILTPPPVAFTIDYPMPKVLRPGTRYKLPVTVGGKIVGGTDTHGYRRLDAILYMGRGWVGGPGLWQRCLTPTGGTTPVCDPPGSVKGSFSIDVPTAYGEGDDFSFGVGALNCSRACSVRVEYESRRANAIGRAELAISASVKAEATAGAETLFPSYVQTKVAGSGKIRLEPDGAAGTFVVSHQFALDAFPDYRTTLVVTGVSGGAFDRRAVVVSVMFRARVRNSTFSGCRVGSTARLTLTDVRPGGKGRDAVRVQVCGNTLTYRDRTPDPSDRVTVTMKRL